MHSHLVTFVSIYSSNQIRKASPCGEAFRGRSYAAELELESRYKRALTRKSGIRRRVDKPKTRKVLSSRTHDLRLGSVVSAGVGRFGAIENIREFGPNVQAVFLLDPEHAAKTHVFHGTALIPVVTVICRRRAELAWSRLGPRCRIQDERLIRIEAVAIQVLSEERNARHPIREGVIPIECGIAIRRRGSPDRQSTSVPQNCSDLPIASDPRQSFDSRTVALQPGCRVIS